MDRCQDFHDLMLEYVYDLVDDDQRQSLTLHLESCATCQAALSKAQKQQQLLASAARRDCAGVQFKPPVAEETPVPTTLAFPPLRSEQTLRRRWPARRYAQAAAILLALAVPGAFAWDYLTTARERAAHEAHQAELRSRVRDLNDSVAHLAQERDEKLEAVHHEVRARQLKVVVSGPASVQAGGLNEYEIQTRDGNDQLVPSTIVAARVVDQTGAVMYEEKAVPSPKGSHRLTLPTSLPIKPHTQVALQVVARRGDSQSELSDQLTLAAPVYLTHLTTDKPLYNPGDKVYFRSLTLDRSSLKPAAEPLQVYFTLTAPTGEETVLTQGATGKLVADAAKKEDRNASLAALDGKALQGIGTGEWQLGLEAPGGEYTLTVKDVANRFAPQQRRFVVNNYQSARLTKTLEFNQRSYGPGDEVVAQCQVSVSGSGPLARCPVQATVRVDDQTYDARGKVSGQPLRFTTDAQGKVSVRFRLPATVTRGQAALTVAFLDGGSPEPLIKTIPIVLDKLLVDFYPEGGDLVAGVPNRVYFQAQTTLGKPADLRGRILDGEQVVAEIGTLTNDDHPGVNQGQGVFTFTPQAGHKYELAISQPVGIKQRVALPALKDSGVVLHVPDGVTTAHKPIALQLHNVGKERSLLIGAYCRGRLFDHRSVTARAGETVKVDLQPAQHSGGVFRITVFEEEPNEGRSQLIPLAERLIYRHQGERLNLTLESGKKTYQPGETAALKVSARGENQDLTPAILMVAVVDKSVVALADEKTARSMPTHFLLTSEVRKPEELEHADFLLTPHRLAEQALDLLLGTQGWRRFAEQKPEEFRRNHPADAARMLASGGPSGETLLVSRSHNGPDVQNYAQAEYLRVQQQIQKRGEELQSAREATRAQVRQAEVDPAYLAVRDHQDKYSRIGYGVRTLFPLLGLVLIVVGCVCLGNALSRPVPRALPLFASAMACAFVFVLLGMLSWVGADRHDPQGAVQMAEARLPTFEKEREEKRPVDKGEKKDAEKEFHRGAMTLTAPLALPGEGSGIGGGGLGAGGPAGPTPLKPGTTGAKGAGGGGFGGAVAPGVGPTNFGADKKQMAGDAEYTKQDQFANTLKAREDQAQFAQRRLDAFRKRSPADAPAQPKAPGGFGPGLAPLHEEQARRSGAFIVREYAHQSLRAKDSKTRSDFTETVYWHPVLVLASGQSEVQFALSDAVTTYQVTVFGHTLDGRLAAAATTFQAQLPFSLAAETPTEITASDRLMIPVTLTNTTEKPQSATVQLGAATNLKQLVKQKEGKELYLKRNSPTRQLFEFVPAIRQGEALVRFDAHMGPLSGDSLERRFKIVPEGFPVAGSVSDMLEETAVHNLILPDTWVKGTLQCQVEVFPSSLADIQKGLEGLLREPSGCFEQSSTVNYPNVLILQYLRATEQSQPDTEAKARALLGRGYNRLVAFECENPSKQKREGYEWFGGAAPPHEALTAYGLLQFRDMAKVHAVDATMIERTRHYLLSRRNGKGGFERNARAIDTFGRAPDHITDAYIVWALTESGPDDDLTTELNHLNQLAQKSTDPYFLALVANSLVNRGRDKDAGVLLKALVKLQKDDGRLEGTEMSVTASRDRDLHIEATALTMLAWMKSNGGEYRAALDRGSKWLCQQRNGSGAFGSTQATILALKAIIRYAEENKRLLEAGTLSLYVGERLVAQKKYAAKTTETLTLEVPNAEETLRPGKNKIRVEITSKTLLPSTLSWSYQTLKPVSAEKAPLKLSTALDRTEVKEGESVQLKVRLENVSGLGQGMAVAVVGLPAGLVLPEDLKQLKDYIRLPADGSRPLVSMFEIRGRELVLYWRDLAPDQKIDVAIDLKCRLPGTFSGPASRAYLYYSADARHWIDPLKVTITPAE